MEIEKYSEDLDEYVSLAHEACEGRYEFTGYDLHVIEAALQQLQNILNEEIRESEKSLIGSREVAMRNKMFFPENEKDIEWFNKGCDYEFFRKLFTQLNLGIV